MTPVSGKIVGRNDKLEEKPAHINKAPEGDGWIAKIEVADEKEMEQLMTKEEYDNFEKE